MGCGCHSAKKAQPVRQARKSSTANTNAAAAMIRNTYASSLNKKRIIRRSIGH